MTVEQIYRRVFARDATQSAREATKMFRTFEEGDPDLVNIGIPEIHRRIGGMGRGNLLGIAMGQNVGKTSLQLSMACETSDSIGIVETEDGPDVWGCRLLARATDISPTKIRRKDLDADEKRRIGEALERGIPGPRIAYAIGQSMDDIVDATRKLVQDGCDAVILNYLQKVRGHHADRRSEVGLTMNRFHSACAPDPDQGYPGAVPIIFSQLVRMHPTKEPYPSSMKESGDIENECRLIVMGWRDANTNLRLNLKVAKSSFGGGGIRFAYQYTPAEYLVPIDERYDDEEEDPQEAADDEDEDF